MRVLPILLMALVAAGGAEAQEGFFSGADGVQLHYRITGPGSDTVVLIHGGPGTGLRETLELEELSRRGHAVLMYDQRGAGRSELVSTVSRLTVASHVADLEALRRHFRLGRMSLVGVSWGAAVALHYGVSYAHAVDRIIFLSPMPPHGRYFVQRFRRLDSLRTSETRARLREIDSLWMLAADQDLPGLCREGAALSGAQYQASATQPRGDVCDYPAPVLRHRKLARVAALTALGAEFDFAPALTRLNRPVLVIEGERTSMPLDATRYWARHAPRARLLLVPGAGHRSWLDRPDELFDAMDRFLRGEWPEGAAEVGSG